MTNNHLETEVKLQIKDKEEVRKKLGLQDLSAVRDNYVALQKKWEQG